MVPAVWGCRRATEPSADVVVQLNLQPTPPVVGTAEATVKLATASGDTVSAAEVRLEGNMNHAGMKPTFAQLTETAPGVYQGQLEFTMGGDWFVLVRVVLPDGRKMEQKIDVRGVRAT